MMVVFFHRKRNNMWLMFKICSEINDTRGMSTELCHAALPGTAGG